MGSFQRSRDLVGGGHLRLGKGEEHSTLIDADALGLDFESRISIASMFHGVVRTCQWLLWRWVFLRYSVKVSFSRKRNPELRGDV